MLGEQSDPNYLKSFQNYLKLRDKLASHSAYTAFEFIRHYTIGTYSNAANIASNTLLHLIGNSVDDAQTAQGDPNTNGSTDPSHSQLAKDHDNHPFHGLAAKLAMEAVRVVGVAMAAYWKGTSTESPGNLAAGYLAHPFDSTWQDQIVLTWARSHPKQLKRGESATEWEALRAAHEKEVRDKIKQGEELRSKNWDYINKNYEKIYGEKNQVKK